MIPTMAETQSRTESKTTPSKTPPSASTVQDGDGATKTRRQAPSAARTREPVRAAMAAKGAGLDEGTPVDLVTGTPAEDLDVVDGVVIPVPGDPATEPVATAAQSHVAGRVGPRTIPEDATSVQSPGVDGVDEVEPGEIRTDTVEGVGVVPVAPVTDDPVGDNLARIDRDLAEGIPLDSQGRRIPDVVHTREHRARLSR